MRSRGVAAVGPATPRRANAPFPPVQAARAASERWHFGTSQRLLSRSGPRSTGMHGLDRRGLTRVLGRRRGLGRSLFLSRVDVAGQCGPIDEFDVSVVPFELRAPVQGDLAVCIAARLGARPCRQQREAERERELTPPLKLLRSDHKLLRARGLKNKILRQKIRKK